MRAVVTGVTGFIGRRLAAHLARAGCDVTAVVRDSAQFLPDVGSSIAWRLEDEPGSLARSIRGHDVLFHLAALVTFDPRRRDELLRNNGDGTRNVLTAARQAGIPRVVVVSSACTIGLSSRPGDVLDEDHPFDPRWERRNAYLCSKRAAELYAFDAAADGQSVVVVNPTTVFGPGDRSLNSGTLVRQVAAGRVIPVPPGGSNVVDVDDVVEGIVAAAVRGRSGQRYILGGENLRFREIIDRIASVVGRRPVCVPVPSAVRLPMKAAAWLVQRVTGSRLITPQIIEDTFAFKFYSSRRAETDLGWRARRSFTCTLAAAWDYYRRERLIAVPAGAAT